MNKQQHTTFDKLCADLEREYPDEMAAARKWAQQLAADIKSGKAKLDIQPFDPNRCLACGENHGSPNLPCPRMRATSVQPSPAPETEQPEIMGFIRYRVEKTGWGFWPYCVRASGGTRELFVGHLKQCERVAARLSAAFEDGKFIAQQHYQRIDAARLAEIERLKEERDAAQAGQVADIKSMVDRFLAWPLPQDFHPDSGISFTPPSNPAWWPTGTNLLSAEQAKAMFEYVLNHEGDKCS